LLGCILHAADFLEQFYHSINSPNEYSGIAVIVRRFSTFFSMDICLDVTFLKQLLKNISQRKTKNHFGLEG
jgi:hypothetical protein